MYCNYIFNKIYSYNIHGEIKYKNIIEKFENKNIKIAIITATYKRKNKDTKKILEKYFQNLYNQDYKKFKVFLIGDNYYDRNEFNEIASSYKGEIYYENLNKDLRNVFKIKRNRWCWGGLYAITRGIEKAIEENYDYYFHLDDDDTWFKNHISENLRIINKFPNVDFIISKSYYKNSILPKEKINKEYYNNWEIKPENTVHSTWCINLKTIGPYLLELNDFMINLIDKIINNEIFEIPLPPGDAWTCMMLRDKQKKKKLNAICINNITCNKESELNIPV